ncbi:hypothetical protein [Marinobacter subterrani]|uniref:hypothetical protein n=1 Tax=Marinobacter subterrani TaxID=1658765 RepID=UPI0023542060|nr:hypothetical protein [Marinobacter subterrani]
MTPLVQQANELEQRAEQVLEAASDEAAVKESDQLLEQMKAVLKENRQRRESAQAKLSEFPQDAVLSAEQNASDTFAQYGDDMLNMCEWWECARDSAQDLMDFGTYEYEDEEPAGPSLG